MTTKTCNKCKKTKPLGEFYKRSGHEGRRSPCKSCIKDRHDQYMITYTPTGLAKRKYGSRSNMTEPELKILRNNDANNRNVYRKKRQHGHKKYKASNKQKIRSHALVSRAIKELYLIKPDNCSICGSEFNIHGHHEDYNKPLDVRWLCSPCHCKRHSEINKKGE